MSWREITHTTHHKLEKLGWTSVIFHAEWLVQEQ